MNTAHTPGPWQHRPTHYMGNPERGDTLFVEACGAPSQGGHICDIRMHHTFRQESGAVDILGPTDEDYANARLIAAAPELLKALEEMVDAYGFNLAAVSNGAIPAGTSHKEKQARAAIVKAKGEDAPANAEGAGE